jgi:Cu+-exporting ATPase
MALEPVAPAPARPATKWTCPMHPQIVRDTPGSCPICGMALEPMTVTAEGGLLAFVMGDMLPGAPLRHLFPGRILTWLQLILATAVVLWAGWPHREGDAW